MFNKKIYDGQNKIYDVQNKIYSVQNKIYNVQCNIYIIKYTIYKIKYKMKQNTSIIIDKKKKKCYCPQVSVGDPVSANIGSMALQPKRWEILKYY